MNLLSLNLILLLCALATALLMALSMSAVRRKQLQTPPKNKRSKKSRKNQAPVKQMLVRIEGVCKRYATFPYSTVVTGCIVGVGFGLSVAAIAQQLFPRDQLPQPMWLIVFPTGLALSYLVMNVLRGWRLIVLSAVTVICAALFSTLVINHYYGYYPTVVSLFGQVKNSETI